MLGEPGAELILQAEIIPLLITGSGATVQGLTMTSDIPYAREFIQIGAPNVSLIGNTIYGPEQPPPMSDWTVNRAVVSQVNTAEVLLEGNTFYSLRTGMYINPIRQVLLITMWSITQRWIPGRSCLHYILRNSWEHLPTSLTSSFWKALQMGRLTMTLLSYLRTTTMQLYPTRDESIGVHPRGSPSE